MIVSWNWLKQYVNLDMPLEELERRLMMAGFNHESTEHVGEDIAIDLEITSNRPDCLGHLGIAREIGVLWDQTPTWPAAQPTESAASVETLTKVSVESPEMCPRYTARVIQGAKVGPSPAWMREHLQTVGVASINNIVDITNYVLLECGQPLHAFDLAKLRGPRIVVRAARAEETLEAINHKSYRLDPAMCVIADAERPVAIAGVMGGAETEVSERTRDLLIESAEFDPLSVRNTARKLGLHSDSSYRFERGIDPEGVDWASRRCGELILELAGGELADGMIDVAVDRPARPSLTLRFSQLKRILGIEIPGQEAARILRALGNEIRKESGESVEVVPPSWRRDLTREIDLVEEVGRIHGYDQIPEDVSVPMVPSTRSDEDRVLEQVRHVLTASGFDEVMTVSAVSEKVSACCSPWTENPALVARTPVLRGADRLRRTLLPSLLGVCRENESLSNSDLEFFEIAKIYLPRPGELPEENWVIALASNQATGEAGFRYVRGVLETLLQSLQATEAPRSEPYTEKAPFSPGLGATLFLADEKWGFLGEVDQATRDQFDLRGSPILAEVRLSTLLKVANLVPQAVAFSSYPPVHRDINLVMREEVKFEELYQTAISAAGNLLESLDLADDERPVYRDSKIGTDKKSLLLRACFRAMDRTLTSEEVDESVDQMVAACREAFGAELRA